MKINTSYTPPIQPPQARPAAAPQSTERDSAESRLRELIAQRHAEFERHSPIEELGKHLDLRA
ncbi:MAG: hypothetical protein IPK53_05095 [bacterium]|nr:hypothetical protein [bacterium]MBK8128333.1 hypothetical protein [bacterium]